MKIFAFDTNFKRNTLKQMKQEYGMELVLVVNRSSLFLWYTVLIPSMVSLCIAALPLWWIYSSGFFEDFSVVVWILVFMFLFFVLGKILKKYIDYIMDFIVVTPAGVYAYNNRWIFHRSGKFLNKQNIRSIYATQTWILYNIFNNGDLNILSEGASDKAGDIVVHYVKYPLKLSHQIDDILAHDLN